MKRFLILLIILSLIFPFSGIAQTKQFQVDTGGTLTTNLISYYKLEDVNDFWSTNNLTNNGSTPFNAAKISNGADFGTGNTTKYLRYPTNVGINGGSASISFWLKVNAEPATNIGYSLVGEAGQLSGYAVGEAIMYVDTSGTKTLMFRRLRQAIAWDTASYTVTLGISNWYHVVLTYDGSNIRGYVNNSLVAGPTASSGTGANNYDEQGVVIGAWYQGGASSFSNAIIDEVGVWDRVLSAQEMTDLYNGGVGDTMCTVGVDCRVKQIRNIKGMGISR